MSIRWSSPTLFNDLLEFQRMPVFEPDIVESYPIYIKRIIEIVFDEKPYDENFSAKTKLLILLNQSLKKTGMSKEELYNEISIPAPADQQRMTDLLREHTENENYIKNARICCLTENYKNDVMWAHYADNNTGCVIGFRLLKHIDTPFIAAKKIKYTDGKPEIGSALNFLLYGDTFELRRKTHEAICFTKDIKWSYENEWRTISWMSETTDQLYVDYKFYTEELESLTMGPNIKDIHKKNLLQLIKENYHSCDLYEMKVVYGEYKRETINV